MIIDEKFIRENEIWEQSRMKFLPITIDEVQEVLNLTIKKDFTNRLLIFLEMLSAYTEESQINIAINAPSSTGKSYIPQQIARLFPQEDVIEKGYCSPTAFYHEAGEYDEVREATIVDLSRKILIFIDQPNPALLERLRAVLSHDSKEIVASITDKKKGAGNRTKKVILRGFPAVTFCSADLKMDEQECTRFIMLSPDMDPNKIKLSVIEKLKLEEDPERYREKLESDPRRIALMERIRAIRDAHVGSIKLGNSYMIQEEFLRENPRLKARHQRDIGRIINLTKAVALLNLWHRDHDGSDIVANEDDFRVAWELWKEISRSQNLNLSPYVLDMFEEIIVPAFIRRGTGVSTQEILGYYADVRGQVMPESYLRTQVLRSLYSAGLIFYEKDPDDHRRNLIFVADSHRGMEDEVEEYIPVSEVRRIHPENLISERYYSGETCEENSDSGVYSPKFEDAVPF